MPPQVKNHIWRGHHSTQALSFVFPPSLRGADARQEDGFSDDSDSDLAPSPTGKARAAMVVLRAKPHKGKLKTQGKGSRGISPSRAMEVVRATMVVKGG